MKIRRKQIYFAIGFLIFAAIGFSQFSLPFLRDKIHFEELYLSDGKVLIISDLHLESNPRDLSCIGDYLKESGISHFIVNGDLFDKMHKDKFKSELLEEGKRRMAIEENPPYNIIYIPAVYNHDPYLEASVKQFQENGYETAVLKWGLKLKTEEDLFYIFHGDYAVSNGIVVPALINKITSTLFFEDLAKWVIKADNDNWVILGHSHISGINYEKKTANSGCWINRIVSNTDTAILIEIEEGVDIEINLVKIPCE